MPPAALPLPGPRAAGALSVRAPGDLAALVPHLTGFAPTESLVAISLRGPRRRVGLTLRADLTDLPGLVLQVVAAMDRDRARACALIVHTEEASGRRHPRTELVQELETALEGRGIEVAEALLVRRGSWWSYLCTRACCPPEGTPLDAGAAVVTAVAAEHAYDGRAVLASRADLVASLQPQLPLGPALARRLQAQALDDLEERVALDERAAVLHELDRWQTALADWEHRPASLPPALTAALAAGLHLIGVRDAVAALGARRGDALLGLLEQLCRAVAPPDDAPLCTVLAGLAYSRGDGARALVALQRALATDPTYSMAELLLAALDGQLPPAEVRAALRAS